MTKPIAEKTYTVEEWMKLMERSEGVAQPSSKSLKSKKMRQDAKKWGY